MQKITLMRRIFKIIRKKGGEDYMTNIKFLDDHFDKRYDGVVRDDWSEDCKDWEDAKIAAYGEMSRP